MEDLKTLLCFVLKEYRGNKSSTIPAVDLIRFSVLRVKIVLIIEYTKNRYIYIYILLILFENLSSKQHMHTWHMHAD